MALPDKKVKELLDEYKNDPVSFRLKYGAEAEADLLETAHKKGMTKEVERKTAKYGGEMQYGGMADMSAAPMVQPRKKKKPQSGFRSKYSKGGGVRSAKYKL